MSSPKLSTLPASDEARTRALLARLCAAPGLHARFLNTLSLLEHIGSRKIMASQSRAELGQDTLRHLAEETRHAFFFKHAAEAVARRPLGYRTEETVAGAQARLYMGRLDAFIVRHACAQAAYLYMSLIVELRAVWFYRLYRETLQEAGIAINLASLLAEERRHLDEMGERLTALGEKIETRLPALFAFEETRFVVLLSALERETATAALAAE